MVITHKGWPGCQHLPRVDVDAHSTEHSMSTVTSTIPAHRLTWTAVHALDLAAQVTAWALGKFTRITGAGVFWYPGHPSFMDAWTEEGHSGGGSLTVRLGRLEVVADWRG